MPDFIKSASLQLRHELGMQWLRFYADHQAGRASTRTTETPTTTSPKTHEDARGARGGQIRALEGRGGFLTAC